MLHKFDTEHGDRVANLSVEIGKQLNDGTRLSEERLKLLEYGARIHDVGRAGIENHVITKKGKLTQSQMAAMREHTVIGYELIKDILPAEITYTVLYHHENWDGSGYPHRLKQLDIPLFARIVRITDFWDGVLSERPYHRARTVAEALDEMNKVFYIFDPRLYAIFLDTIREEHDR